MAHAAAPPGRPPAKPDRPSAWSVFWSVAVVFLPVLGFAALFAFQLVLDGRTGDVLIPEPFGYLLALTCATGFVVLHQRYRYNRLNERLDERFDRILGGQDHLRKVVVGPRPPVYTPNRHTVPRPPAPAPAVGVYSARQQAPMMQFGPGIRGLEPDVLLRIEADDDEPTHGFKPPTS